jgi:hypothetical protein
MEKKFLLYIDILGFSNMTKDNPAEARRLYYVIEQLNAHKHDQFKVIVFSDTILIYNLQKPISDMEKEYYVMFLIEFAQNLLYSCIGKKFYFRALILNGEFEHSTSTNIERFFGKALIDAYSKEKLIQATGLFIEKQCDRFNKIFPSRKYDDQFRFVYLNQRLDSLARGELGDIPIKLNDFSGFDNEWHLAKDIHMLKDIHSNMRNNPDPKIRSKFLTTWDFYVQQYPNFLQKLVQGNFNLSIICKDFNWDKALLKIQEGYKGFGICPPSIKEFKEIIEKAKKAGSKAAKEEDVKIYGKAGPQGNRFSPCGLAYISLDVDRKSDLGKFLSKTSEKNVHIRILNSKKEFGLKIDILGMHKYQERKINESAAKAAMMVLKKELHVDGYVESCYI